MTAPKLKISSSDLPWATYKDSPPPLYYPNISGSTQPPKNIKNIHKKLDNATGLVEFKITKCGFVPEYLYFLSMNLNSLEILKSYINTGHSVTISSDYYSNDSPEYINAKNNEN